jgi:ribosomal protein S4E
MQLAQVKALINFANVFPSQSLSSTIYFQHRKRLNLALTGREVTLIMMDKEGGFKVDNKIRRDHKFPVGVMDTLSVVKTG